jgi:MFS family permease
LIQPEHQSDPFAAVRLTQYRNLITGRFCFTMGLRMLSTLVSWWLYELTGDPLAIGLIGLTEVIPAISLALYAGHVIDTREKKNLLMKGMFCYLLCGLTLFGLSSTFFSKHSSHQVLVGGIYAVIFCTGIIRAFVGPSFSAILGHIVPKSTLQNAITWNQGTYLSASVAGHATGGFCIAAFGINGTMMVIVALITLSLFNLQRLQKAPAKAGSGDKRTWDSVKEGLQFVFRTKEVLGALSLDLFAVLFGGAVAMVPIYAKDILRVSSIGFGWLNAASDIGSIIIVVLLTLYPLRKHQGKRLLMAVAGFGLCIVIFGISKTFWLSFVALMIGGILDGISVVVRGTIVQLQTPDEMRGRVMSVNSMFINSSNELGQFESGVAARAMGVVPSVVFGGCMTLLVVIVTWFKAPTLRKMQY